MLKRYDETQQSWVDTNSIKRYDTTQQSWIDVSSAKRYDTTEQAWVEKLESYIYFTELAFSFSNGGSCSVSEDKKTINFKFKTSSYGSVDNASLQWEGKEIVNSVFMGKFESSDDDTNPDVYFYYQGNQVLSRKLRTQDDNLFGIYYEGAVDKIIINIVPNTESTFSIINPSFGKVIKFEI